MLSFWLIFFLLHKHTQTNARAHIQIKEKKYISMLAAKPHECHANNNTAKKHTEKERLGGVISWLFWNHVFYLWCLIWLFWVWWTRKFENQIHIKFIQISLNMVNIADNQIEMWQKVESQFVVVNIKLQFEYTFFNRIS